MPYPMVTGGYRKLHTEELHNLYSSQNIISVIKSKRITECSTCGEVRNALKIVVGGMIILK
jgi:hypothetical protein